MVDHKSFPVSHGQHKTSEQGLRCGGVASLIEANAARWEIGQEEWNN